MVQMKTDHYKICLNIARTKYQHYLNIINKHNNKKKPEENFLLNETGELSLDQIHNEDESSFKMLPRKTLE